MSATKKLWWKIVAVLISIVMIFSFSNIYSFASSKDANDGDFYMVTLGDSVCAGYGIDDLHSEDVLDYPEINMYSCSKETYSYQVAEYVYNQLVDDGYIQSQGDFTYFVDRTDGFGWANLGGAGFTAEALHNVLTDPEYKPLVQKKPYYDLFTSEIKKADLVTVQIGNNDILENGIMDLYKQHYGNYAFYALGEIVTSISYGTTSAEELPTLISEVISKYSDKITYDDLIELIEFLEPDSLSDYFMSYESSIKDSLAAIYADIKGINSNTQVVFVGAYNPYGTSLALPNNQGGYTTFDFATIVDRTLDNMQEVVKDKGVSTLESTVLDQASSILQESQDDIAPVVSNIGENLDISLDVESTNTTDVDKLSAQANLDTLSSDSGEAPQFKNYEQFIEWTKNNLSDWKNWNSATWNSWATQMKNYASDYNMASSIADAIEELSDEGTSITDLDELISQIADKTGYSIEVITDFLSQWASVSKEFFISDGESLKALAEKIRSNKDEYATLLVKFLYLANTEEKEAVVDQLMSDLEYPLMHMILGDVASAALTQYDTDVKSVAEATDSLYVSIMGIDNESNLDPHPDTSSNKRIAELIEETITLPVKVTSGFGGTASAINESGICNGGTEVVITPEKNYKVSSITNNGKEIDLSTLTTNADGTQTFIAEVGNTGANVNVTFAKQDGNDSIALANIGETPQTGDTTLYAVAAIALIALGAISVLVVTRRQLR